MNQRHLLSATLVLSVLCGLSACRHEAGEHRPHPPEPATLKVILNGPFAIVLDKNKPSRITAFTPRDPQGMHRVYVNDLEKDRDREKDYHFKLLSDGLNTTGRRPYIDQYFRDFNVETDEWKRENYAVTIDLPVPDVISFTLPAPTLFFENGKKAFMPLNHILEYRVDDAEKIRLFSAELKDLHPLSCAELLEQFEHVCAKQLLSDYQKSCREMKGLLSSCTHSNTKTFFFGVGLPAESLMTNEEKAHAVHFFNDVLLRSFPHLRNLRLAPLDNPGQTGNGSPGGMLIPAVVKYPMPNLRLLPVSAVIDCKVGGFIVTTP
jgi:hypothetical protein